MKKSDSIELLSAALCQAQAEMPKVIFDSTNPFLKNRYATLGAVIEATRPVLARHNLAITQFPVSQFGASKSIIPEALEKNEPEVIVTRERTGAVDIGIETVLVHTSGQWLSESLYVPISKEKGKSNAQMAGSIITYLRRYAWASVLGIYSDEDTDGNEPDAPGAKRGGSTARDSAKTAVMDAGARRSPEEEGGFDAAGSETVPKKDTTKGATPAYRAKMIKDLKAGPDGDNRKLVTNYFRAVAALLPNEELEDMPLRFVPTSKEDMDKLPLAIGKYENGDQAVLPYPIGTIEPEPPKGRPKPVEVPRDKPTDAHDDDDAWRSFPVPFGRHAGVILDEIDKKVLYGFWANFKVETEYNGHPKKAESIAKDRTFRAMLDAAGEHYKFTVKE